jgi:8-oxo-dGTP pyrophosphatase MutT (NUDIX family)
MGGGGTVQVAALPWRRKADGTLEILLITSRETKRWVIPKGWPMAGLKDYNAARREAFEEAGIAGAMRKKPVGTFHYGKRTRSGGVKPLDVTVYAQRVEKMLPSWPEKAERKRKWFSLSSAAKAVHESQLQGLILKFKP